MDLRGIAPDATGDLSSEEFDRRIREGWTPPRKVPSPGPEDERIGGKTLLEWMDCIQCCDSKVSGFECSEATRGYCSIAVEKIRSRLAGPVQNEERIKQIMALVSNWTIWVDRTKCRWDEKDQKAFQDVLDILWASRLVGTRKDAKATEDES